MSARARRLHPRWCLLAAVELTTDDGTFVGLSYDVSAGGMFVATSAAPAIGTAVELTVLLPDGTRLELTGQVRWVRAAQDAESGLPAGCGIEWDVLPMDALRALLHFAELQEPQAHEA